MNQILNPPNEYTAGLLFDYSVWGANTEVTLVNVPWNADYRDIVKFANQAELDAYIDSRETTFTKVEVQYIRVSDGIKLEIPFASAYKFNYIRVKNPAQPIAGDVQKAYYYFITDIRHIAPSTTLFQVQLDVWQTFGRDIKIGSSYIERGHIGIANQNAFNNFGREYLTMPEGLDTGAEYRIIAKRKENVANLEIDESTTPPTLTNLYDVLVVSATDLMEGGGTVEDPELKSAPGGGLQMTPSGATFYVFGGSSASQFGASSFMAYMTAMKDKPWVTQGIISVTIIPSIKRYIPDFEYAANGIPKKLNYGLGFFPKQYSLFDNWRDSDEILNKIPARYRHLKKFLTYPYMCIELTTWYGSPLVIKPESWAASNAPILERVSLTPPNQRIGFHPRNYNAVDRLVPHDDLYEDLDWYPGYSGGDGDDNGDYLDAGVYIASFPNAPIVNDMAVNFLASNAHGIAWQNDSASWSQQRALMGNQQSFDNTQRSLAADALSNRMSRDAATAQMNIQSGLMGDQMITSALGSVGTGTAMGALGGPAGAAVGALGGGANALVNAAQTGLRQNALAASNQVANTASRGIMETGQGATRDIAGSNKRLADWAARGDYENQIAGINARVQDSRLIQPSVGGQFGGDGMNFNNNTVELNVRWKMIDIAHIRAIGDYWLRYGYAVNQFATIPASLMVMSKFTYWKLAETYFTSATVPEGFKQAIRGLFEKGVTVWKNPDDIGNIDWADNVPLPGVTL